MNNKKVGDILLQLNQDERKILKLIKLGSLEKIIKESGMDETRVKRALQFLSNKGIVELKKEKIKEVRIGNNGVIYLKNELPERRLINALGEQPELSFKEAKEKAKLSDNELQVSIGILKKENFIEIKKDKIILKVLKEEIIKKNPKEKFLENLPIEYNKLDSLQKKILSELLKRKDIVKIVEKTKLSFSLTEKFKSLVDEIEKISSFSLIEKLTPEMIKKETWKSKQFRHYDVKSFVPKIFGGKKHFYLKFLEEIRKKLIAMGFKEMTGDLIVNEFWNFDALFQPQFHVARDWSETYKIKNELKLKIPPRKIIKKVKNIHEKKWHYSWDIKKSLQPILRPQGTVLSALTLASQPEIPSKYFALARCFRPDIPDSRHLPEFNQVEGIIIGEKLNFKNLLGTLKMFAKEIANAKDKDIIFKPDYYPFTEPSVELDIKHEKFGKIEIGGAGIFRQEIINPLLGKNYSKDINVLAWGLGIDRFAMYKYKIKDIRQLFTQDLKFLREKF